MSEHENKLQHLTAEQIEALYAEYVAGEKVAVLLERYAIDLKPAQLIRALPPRLVEGLACPYCGTTMQQRRRARSMPSFRKEPAFCATCAHQHHFSRRQRESQPCTCPPCRKAHEQARQQREAELRQRVVAFHGPEAVLPVPFAHLDLTQKLQLMALFETGSDWRLDDYLPAVAMTRHSCVAPSQRMQEALLQDLREARVLLIDPASPLEAFERGPAPVPLLDRVHWLVNVSLDDRQRASLADLYRALHRALSRGPMPAWHDEIAQAIGTLAVEEVYGYLEHYCAEHSLPLVAWKKSREVITQLLHELPVCQIWYLAHLAVNHAVVYFNKGTVSRTQASNTIPGRMLVLGRKAVDEAWTIRWHKHSTKAPCSGFNDALHTLLLKHDDHGREKRISSYLQALPRSASDCGGRRHDDDWHCDTCGSFTVHVQKNAQEIVVNCKDCMARTIIHAGGSALT